MPDTIIKIIPRNPFDQIPESLLQKGADFLNGAMRCDSIRIQCSNSPVFVDCGSNLERIVCPECGSKLSFDWWGEIMTRAAKSGFSALEIILPCCGKKNSLNDLKYYFPCGFACCQIDLLNPTDNLEAALIDSGKALGAVKPGPHSSGTHQLRGLPRRRGENGILRQPLQDSSVRIKKGRDHLRSMSGTGNLRDGWGDIRE